MEDNFGRGGNSVKAAHAICYATTAQLLRRYDPYGTQAVPCAATAAKPIRVP